MDLFENHRAFKGENVRGTRYAC